MKENGSMIRLKGLACIPIWMELSILESGKKTNSMGKEKKLGLMVQCTKETMYSVGSKVLEISNGLMDLFTLVNSSTIILKEWENIVGLMEGVIMENGVIIKCTEKEFSSGQMAENMKVTTLKIKNKDLEYSFGLMGENI